MLKCDIDSTPLNFDDLSIGETFRIKSDDYEWYGMKVKEGGEYEDYIAYVMDISDDIGRLYEWDSRYNIVELVNLKIVRE